MKTIKTTILCMATFCAMALAAQNTSPAFYTVGKPFQTSVGNMLGGDSLNEERETTAGIGAPDSLVTSKGNFSSFSIEQLEKLIAKYEDFLALRPGKKGSKPNKNVPVHCYYEGKSHELTLENLMSVMDEVGISNQLFVLAQAVLETGNFGSNVCRNYHNLFGLYDSRNKCYYKFARWEDSVIGYQKFIQYRYKGGNYLAFLRRIGYAEDPSYTSKVAQIAKRLYKQLFN
jgi:hypothetical protein